MLMKLLQSIACVLLLAICLISPDAYAEGQSDTKNGVLEAFKEMKGPPPRTDLKSAPNSASIIDNVAKAILDIFPSPGQSGLTDFGKKALAGFAIISVVFLGVRFAGGMIDNSGLIVEGLKLLVAGSVAYSAFAVNPLVSSIIGDVTLGEFIQNGFYQLANVNPEKNPFGNFLSSWADIISAIWSVKSFPSMGTGLSALFSIVEYPITFIGAILGKIMCTVMLLAVALLGLGHLFMAMLQMKLLLFVAPLVAPFMLFKPLSFLWQSWLKGFISAGFLLFVANLYNVGGTHMMEAIQRAVNLAQAGEYTFGSMFLAYVCIVLACGIYCMVAMKIDNFASSLVSGGMVGGFNPMQMYEGGKNFGRGIKRATQVAEGTAAATRGTASAGSYALNRVAAGNHAVQAASAAKEFAGGGALSRSEAKDARMSGKAAFDHAMGRTSSSGGAMAGTLGAVSAFKTGASLPTSKSDSKSKPNNAISNDALVDTSNVYTAAKDALNSAVGSSFAPSSAAKSPGAAMAGAAKSLASGLAGTSIGQSVSRRMLGSGPSNAKDGLLTAQSKIEADNNAKMAPSVDAIFDKAQAGYDAKMSTAPLRTMEGGHVMSEIASASADTANRTGSSVSPLRSERSKNDLGAPALNYLSNAAGASQGPILSSSHAHTFGSASPKPNSRTTGAPGAPQRGASASTPQATRLQRKSYSSGVGVPSSSVSRSTSNSSGSENGGRTHTSSSLANINARRADSVDSALEKYRAWEDGYENLSVTEGPEMVTDGGGPTFNRLPPKK